MTKHWLTVLLCVIGLLAAYDAFNRIGLILDSSDIPDRFATQTAVVSSIDTQRECSGSGKSRVCQYQAYLSSESGQRYKVFMRPFFDKGLDRLYGVPKGSRVSMSVVGIDMYAFSFISTTNETEDVKPFPLSEFNQWRSDSLFSASGFLILDGLLVLLVWRRVSSMSLPETRAFVKFALVAFVAMLTYLFFPSGDLPSPEELHTREITFSHVSRQAECPPAWPTHPRLTCDYTPYLVSQTGERWTFGPGYKLPEVFATIPPPGTTLYLETYRGEVYRIQRPPTWASDKPKQSAEECDTKLVPVEDDGLVHWTCKGEGYTRPADHDRRKSPFYQIVDRNLNTAHETLEDQRSTLMSYDAVKTYHQERRQVSNHIAGTLLTWMMLSTIVIILLRTFWPRKRDDSAL